MKKALILFLLTFLITNVIQAQEKTTLNVKDLNSSIEKYIKKNYDGYKTVEAFKFDVIFETTIQKASSTESLVFNRDGKFLYKKTDEDKAKTSMQTRTTLALKDVESDITKYIKKNFEGYKLTEAFKYDEVYATKVMKGAESETLLFDKDGNFVKKVSPAAPAAPPAPPAKPAMKADTVPQKPDSIH